MICPTAIAKSNGVLLVKKEVTPLADTQVKEADEGGIKTQKIAESS